ncbi:heme-binding protein, partial [Pseudomonas sp. TNT11]
MSALTLKVAVNLAGQALAAGRAIVAAPLTIAVLDGGGHLITLQREDGASLLRPQIAIGITRRVSTRFTPPTTPRSLPPHNPAK